MMESMFEGISTDGMFGGGHAEKIYRSMLLDEYGKAMAKTGSIGVKDEVMRSILEMQEMETNGYIQG
ncbi:MAG: rod-binding protein [Alphaproteobacteria bacterium]